MRKYFLLLISFVFSGPTLLSQNETDRAYIISQTNTLALKEIAEQANQHYIRLLQQARITGIDTVVVFDNNQKGYLSGFTKKGKPIYDSADNLRVAVTGRISEIWNGGSTGLDLDGTGVEIGHWEPNGLAHPTHEELNGKITHAEPYEIDGHATHTACTILGTGVNFLARGMASNATIISRRSDNDEFEIANFAMNGGILSNHSYSSGNPNGILINLYGNYIGQAKQWDEILYNAPYLTICKSASNDRNQEVNINDEGYDLVYGIATAKNLLTIGAVNDVIEYSGPESINQSTFSSYGPTDDWRIKPDLTANGVGVFSADSDFEDFMYSSKSGTSMSTASVTGAIALLQQHFHNQQSVYMKAETVKALLLSTADEAGNNDGPDFENGWGLLNAEQAASVISNNGLYSRIEESFLLTGETHTTTVETDGTEKLTAMIAWADPSGQIINGADNTTPRLVNDLDLRIFNEDNTYLPWVMSPNKNSTNFTDPATRGDNFRDNVECVEAGIVPAGIYTITVSHKGQLTNNHQTFSLVTTGIVENLSSTQKFEENEYPLSLYPNPSQDGFFNMTLESHSPLMKTKVYDLLGQLVFDDSSERNTSILNLSHLNSGMYLVNVYAGNEVYQEMIFIGNK